MGTTKGCGLVAPQPFHLISFVSTVSSDLRRRIALSLRCSRIRTNLCWKRREGHHVAVISKENSEARARKFFYELRPQYTGSLSIIYDIYFAAVSTEYNLNCNKILNYGGSNSGWKPFVDECNVTKKEPREFGCAFASVTAFSYSRSYHVSTTFWQRGAAGGEELHERLLRRTIKSSRCNFKRPLGAVWHPNERDCSNDLQPARISLLNHRICADPPLFRNDFVEIMEMLDKRLNDKGKNWRHVFKVRIRPIYTVLCV